MQGALPEKEGDAERVARQATTYCIWDGKLYRKRPNDISLRCISRDQGKELLSDIHAGDCGHHSSSRTLVGKAFRNGFYWPTALNDAVELVKACEACQFHAKQIHQPAGGLQTTPLMTVRSLGAGHSGPISSGARGLSLPLRHCGQLHQLSAPSQQAPQSSSSRVS